MQTFKIQLLNFQSLEIEFLFYKSYFCFVLGEAGNASYK